MATLQTGTNRLQAIQRQRQMADALAMQAMSTQPIQSPWQGAAKLAQAWVAAKMMKGATGREDELMAERAKALTEALTPNEFTTPRVAETLPLEQISGAEVADPGMVKEITGFDRTTREKTPAEILQSLPTDLSENIVGNLLQRQMMVQLGLTPEQIKTKEPTMWDKKFALVQQLDPDGSKGLLGAFATQGDIKLGKGNWRDEASGNIRGVVDVNGMPFERDPESVNGIGAQITTPGAWVGQSIQVDDPSKLGGVSKQLKIPENIVQGMTVLDQFGQLEAAIDMGGMTTEAGVGAFRSFGVNAVASLKQLGATLGYPTMEIAGGAKDTGQLIDTGRYVRGKQSLDGAYKVTEADREKYTQREIDEAFGAWQALAGWDAATQQLAISIAYTLARIADPGGRLSEMDVMNQMKGLQLGSADPRVRKIALNRAKRTFAVNLKAQLGVAALNNEEFKVPPEFTQQLDQIIRETDLRTIGSTSDAPVIDLNDPQAQQDRTEYLGILNGPDGELKTTVKLFFRSHPQAAAALQIPRELYE
jgi:hypothetical protein